MTSYAGTYIRQVCTFFGGPEDPTTHTYRSPTIANLSVVRRAWPKREDKAEYFVGKPPGTTTGAICVVYMPGGSDRRVALPAVIGRRKSRYRAEMHCFIWSTAGYAEDTQDFGYDLRDQIITKIRTDPTLGSGGIEAGQFQVGEGGDGGDITWEWSQAATDKYDNTRAYLLVAFEAHAFEVG